MIDSLRTITRDSTSVLLSITTKHSDTLFLEDKVKAINDAWPDIVYGYINDHECGSLKVADHFSASVTLYATTKSYSFVHIVSCIIVGIL